MQITYYGHSCFCLTSSSGVTVLTDPFTRVGYEMPKGLKADVVTVSHAHFDHNYTAGVQTARIISKTGKYTEKDVEIVGFSTYHDEKKGALRGENTVFIIKMDGLIVCHFGDVGEPYSEKFAKACKGADVFLLPVGGTYTVNAAQAKEYVDELRPKRVIPMHFKPSDGALDIEGVEGFLRLFEEKDIVRIQEGSVALSAERVNGGFGVIYLERVK